MDDFLLIMAAIVAFAVFATAVCKGDGLKWRLGDKTQFLISKINEWHPRGCKTEKDYEKSLCDYLRRDKILPKGIRVTSQYARGRMRADLVIDDRVAIEMKHNLDTTGKLQRLIGQLMGYKNWKMETLVILTGKTEPNIRKELNGFVKKEMKMETLRVYQK